MLCAQNLSWLMQAIERAFSAKQIGIVLPRMRIPSRENTPTVSTQAVNMERRRRMR